MVFCFYLVCYLYVHMRHRGVGKVRILSTPNRNKNLCHWNALSWDHAGVHLTYLILHVWIFASDFKFLTYLISNILDLFPLWSFTSLISHVRSLTFPMWCMISHFWFLTSYMSDFTNQIINLTFHLSDLAYLISPMSDLTPALSLDCLIPCDLSCLIWSRMSDNLYCIFLSLLSHKI